MATTPSAWEYLQPARRRYRRAYAGGTFDLFHPGHVALFRRVREQVADELVVAVNTDAFAAEYKRPTILRLEERLELVASCRYVTAAVVHEGRFDSRATILAAGADVIVHGDDWTGGPLCRQMGLSPEWLAEHRIALYYLPYTASVSTSEILRRVEVRRRANVKAELT